MRCGAEGAVRDILRAALDRIPAATDTRIARSWTASQPCPMPSASCASSARRASNRLRLAQGDPRRHFVVESECDATIATSSVDRDSRPLYAGV